MMKRIVVALALATCCMTGAQAQMASGAPKIAPGTMIEPARSFGDALSALEEELMGAVKAMPAEKFGFAPSAAIFAPSQKTDYLSPDNKGVRSFGAMVAHIAQANYFYRQRAERAEAGCRCEGHWKPDGQGQAGGGAVSIV